MSARCTLGRHTCRAYDRTKNDLEALHTRVASLRSTNFPNLLQRLPDDHGAAGLTEEQWLAFQVNFEGDVDTLLSVASETTARALAEVAGTSPAQPTNNDELTEAELNALTVCHLLAESERLRGLVGLDERRGRELKALERHTQ